MTTPERDAQLTEWVLNLPGTLYLNEDDVPTVMIDAVGVPVAYSVASQFIAAFPDWTVGDVDAVLAIATELASAPVRSRDVVRP